MDSWTDWYRAEELNELADVRQIEEHPCRVGAVQYYRPKRTLLSSHFFLLLLLPPQPSLLNICLCSFNMLLHIRRVDQPLVKGEFPLPFARGCPSSVVDLRRIGWLPWQPTKKNKTKQNITKTKLSTCFSVEGPCWIRLWRKHAVCKML